MKQALNFAPTFVPASKTLDFSGYSGFQLSDLYAIINVTKGQLIFAVGQTGFGCTSFSSGILTLEYNTAAHSNSDVLMVLYDVTDIGSANDSAATTDNGVFSLIALTKRLLGKFPSLGQATMAASQPVAIASDQVESDGSFPVSQRGLVEKLAVKAMTRLTYTSSGELRTQFTNTLPTGTNSIGTVGINANQVVSIVGSTTYGASQMLTQQCYQQSFRRNLSVT